MVFVALALAFGKSAFSSLAFALAVLGAAVAATVDAVVDPLKDLTDGTRAKMETLRGSVLDAIGHHIKARDLAPQLMALYEKFKSETGLKEIASTRSGANKSAWMHFIRFYDPKVPMAAAQYEKNATYNAFKYLRRIASDMAKDEVEYRMGISRHDHAEQFLADPKILKDIEARLIARGKRSPDEKTPLSLSQIENAIVWRAVDPALLDEDLRAHTFGKNADPQVLKAASDRDVALAFGRLLVDQFGVLASGIQSVLQSRYHWSELSAKSFVSKLSGSDAVDAFPIRTHQSNAEATIYRLSQTLKTVKSAPAKTVKSAKRKTA